MGKRGTTLWPSADYSSNQNSSRKGRLSLQPSLYYRVIWACMCQRRSKPATMIGTEEETAKKANTHVLYFQTTDTSYLPFSRQRVRTNNELLFLHRGVKTRNMGYERNLNSKMMPRWEPWERRKSFSFEWTGIRGMVSLVKRIPNEKTFPLGKR